MDKGYISPIQFATLMYMFTVGTAALIQPQLLADIAGQDAWFSVMVNGVIHFAFIWLYMKMAFRYPDKTIIEYSRTITGPWLGTGIGIVYLLFFYIIAALVLRNIGSFIEAVILPKTPIDAAMLVMLLPVAYGVFLGIEVIGRASQILFPIAFTVFIIGAVLLIPKMDFTELLPMFPGGIGPGVKGAYPLLGFPICETVISLMLFRFVAAQRNIGIYFYSSVALSVITGMIITLITIIVLGVEETARSPYVVYEAAKEIHVERIFERVEAIVGIIWICTSFIKITLCFYVVTIATVQCFKLNNYKHFIVPYAFLMLPFSLWCAANSIEVRWFVEEVYPMFAIFPGLLIPTALLLTDSLRSYSNKSTDKKENTT